MNFIFEATIARASAFRGATAPNPPVGAAAWDHQGRLLGVGAHERAGTAHAEAGLLTRLQEEGRLAEVDTLFITLEPCNHSGRTPPCTEAILRAGIRRVIYGAPDPNPKVAGGGARTLLNAGVDIQLIQDSTYRAACEDLIAPFAKWARTGLPWITVKTAHRGEGEPSNSASMIPPTGQKTFTSESSLQLAHELRHRADAILTGSGTVLADDPEFTVRRVTDHLAVTQGFKPRKLVVLDRRGRVTTDWLKKAEKRGFEVWVRSNAREAIAELGASGALEVLIEAGPAVSGYFLSQSLWDEHVLIRSRPQGVLQGDLIDVYRNRSEDRADHP